MDVQTPRILVVPTSLAHLRMTDPRPLHIYEEILLLALQDEKGTVTGGTWYSYAIGGALLSELVLAGRVRAEGKKKELEVVDDTPMGDPVLDDCLAMLCDAKKPKPMTHWLTKVSQWKNLKRRAAESLCEKGILRAEKDKVLFIFERDVYPEADPEPEREVIERLRHVIFEDDLDVDPRTVVLLSLAKQTEILKTVFDRKDLKRRKARIEDVIAGEASGEAAASAVHDIQMAIVMSTVFIPIIIT